MGKLAYRLWKQMITIKLERMCDCSSICLVPKESIKDGWRSLSVCLANACKEAMPDSHTSCIRRID